MENKILYIEVIFNKYLKPHKIRCGFLVFKNIIYKSYF